MAKILGICGSVRHGSTEYALQKALAEAATLPGIETELWSVRGKKIAPCVQCDSCVKNKTMCNINDDFQEIEAKILAADALLFASPVYEMTITPQLGALISRLRPCYIVHPGHFRFKPGGAIAVGGTRHGGQEMVNLAIHNFYMMMEMFAFGGVGGTYNGATVWSKDNKAQGAMDDEIGMATVLGVGRGLAEATIVSLAGRKALAELAKTRPVGTLDFNPLKDH